MIKLNRPAVPATLHKEGKRATAKLKRDYTKGTRSFTFRAAVYGATDVRAALRTMHHHKCAFCESLLPQITAGHVEHFRPKGGVQQDEDTPEPTPGYYWLAYHWENLLLACEWCNTRAKRKLFPLEAPAARVCHHTEDTATEAPLLLNPAEDDPALHLEFVGEEIRPRNSSPRGQTSIRIYRLDDQGLTEERRKKLQLFQALRDLARLTEPLPEAQLARAEAARWEQRIQSGEIEYAAMLRENLH